MKLALPLSFILYRCSAIISCKHIAANGGIADGDIVFQMKIGDHKAELTWQPSFFQNAGDNGWILGL